MNLISHSLAQLRRSSTGTFRRSRTQGFSRVVGGCDMISVSRFVRLLPVVGLLLAAAGAEAQTFHVQCPSTTTTHPDGGGIKCQQVSGGDGYASMADGHQIYLFGFGPLSGLKDLYNGQPATEPNTVFNTSLGSDGTTTPSSLVGMPNGSFTFNGAIGLTNDLSVEPWAAGTTYLKGQYVRTSAGIYIAAQDGTSSSATNASGPTPTSLVDGTVVWAYQGGLLDGYVQPRPIMDVGVMNANAPAPLIAIDEDDELFLTLTNVGMIMRPDLFEQHTVHFHGYPNAASFYDGVPDASVAISIGASFSYYYLAPDAGTYFWHCHISPPEHLQMGMVGQLYVRPRQNRVSSGTDLYTAVAQWETAPAPKANPTSPSDWATYEPYRKRCGTDILCSAPLPKANDHVKGGQGLNAGAARVAGYAYNDGDGSTWFSVEYPIQMMGFDPNFHFVGMTFNAEDFITMKDKYFLLNGRSYPDTVGGHACTDGDTLPACAGHAVNDVVPGPMETQAADGTSHASQPLPTVINIPAGGRALLRLSNLSVSEYHTLATMGVPMRVVGWHARLLRDLDGNDMTYLTNSITIGGGESCDVILDAAGLTAGNKFYLYTPALDELSNDAENFGGMMTEVNICTNVDPVSKACS
jgi:FtsP/CotA-like multicopper oxidase with cupredoxin domain